MNKLFTQSTVKERMIELGVMVSKTAEESGARHAYSLLLYVYKNPIEGSNSLNWVLSNIECIGRLLEYEKQAPTPVPVEHEIFASKKEGIRSIIRYLSLNDLSWHETINMAEHLRKMLREINHLIR